MDSYMVLLHAGKPDVLYHHFTMPASRRAVFSNKVRSCLGDISSPVGTPDGLNRIIPSRSGVVRTALVHRLDSRRTRRAVVTMSCD